MPACPGSSMTAPPALRWASSRSKNRTPSGRQNHGVLPRGLPLLKRAIAVGRDQIGQSAGVVYVNSMVAAEALDHDREGRPLPFWQGCANSGGQCWQSSRSSSSPPLRSPPMPLAVALPQTFRQAPLGVHGVKYRTPSRRNMLVVPPSATLERRRADHGLSPAACLFRNHVIAASSNQIGRRGLGIPEPRGRRRYVRP
jgi:type IV secretory pathway protease TraF